MKPIIISACLLGSGLLVLAGPAAPTDLEAEPVSNKLGLILNEDGLIRKGEALPSAAAGSIGFEKDVKPLLQKHCFSCHGPEKQKGDLRLDSLEPDMVNGNAGETWHDALDMLNRGEMPPEKELPLPAEERRVLVAWLTKELGRAAEARKNTGRQVVMRRLNRPEYQHTMTDLLGLEMNYGESLPSDARSPEGFKNNGASLGMTALQIENYLKTARKALDLILVEGDPPERSVSPV